MNDASNFVDQRRTRENFGLCVPEMLPEAGGSFKLLHDAPGHVGRLRAAVTLAELSVCNRSYLEELKTMFW